MASNSRVQPASLVKVNYTFCYTKTRFTKFLVLFIKTIKNLFKRFFFLNISMKLGYGYIQDVMKKV